MISFPEWPAWLGSPSQVVLLVLVVIALIKIWPILQKQVFEARASREGRYGERIRHLEIELHKCHEECAAKIEKLQTKINNEAWQRVQSEISLVSTIIQVVDAPQLRQILAALERRKMTLIQIEAVENLAGPVDDAKGDDQ